jgi:hypothetical protein
MALLVDVSDDQKGLGSVLAISSNVLVENKITPSAPMQMVRCIYMVFPLSPLLNELIMHATAWSVRNIIFCCFMMGSWDFSYLVLIILSRSLRNFIS